MLAVVPGAPKGVFVDPITPWRIRRPRGPKPQRATTPRDRYADVRQICKNLTAPYASIFRFLDPKNPGEILEKLAERTITSLPPEATTWKHILRAVDGTDEEAREDELEDAGQRRGTGRPAYRRACQALGLRCDYVKLWEKHRLDLRGVALSFNDASAVVCGLLANRTMREFLCDNARTTFYILAQLPSSQSLTALDLSRCGLVASNLRVVPTSLQSFKLRDNPKLGDDGADVVAEAITSTLTFLDVSRCGISDDGASALGLALDASNIEEVDLSYNNLRGCYGGCPIFWAAPENLRSLNMAFCGLTEDDDGNLPEAMAYVLSRASNLTSLDVSANRLGERSGFAVASALPKAQTLATLKLGFNPGLEKSTVAVISAAVNSHSTLRNLAIENSDLGNEQHLIDLVAESTATVLPEFPKRHRVVVPRYVDVDILKLQRRPEAVEAPVSAAESGSEDRNVVQEAPAPPPPDDDVTELAHPESKDHRWIETTVTIKNTAARMVEKLEVEEEAMNDEGRPWRLRESKIWKSRRKRGFFDAPTFLRDAARKDLDMSKVKQILKADEVVYESLFEAVVERFQDLDLIHRSYAALGEERPFALQWNEWRDLVGELGIVAARERCSLEELDIIFIAANVGKDRSEKKDDVLTRGEFIEALIRIAMRRYGGDPSEAFRRLLEVVGPRAENMHLLQNGDRWRSERLYTEDVDNVLTKYKPLCRVLWTKAKKVLGRKRRKSSVGSVVVPTATTAEKKKKPIKKGDVTPKDDDDVSMVSSATTATQRSGRRTSFTNAGNKFQALAYSEKALSLDDWLRLTDTTQGRVTAVDSRLGFVLSKATRLADSAKGEDHAYLSYTEYLEALCRASEFLDPDLAVTVDAKLPRLLELLARGTGSLDLYHRRPRPDDDPVVILATDLDDLRARAMAKAGATAAALHRRRVWYHDGAIDDRRKYLEDHRFFRVRPDLPEDLDPTTRLFTDPKILISGYDAACSISSRDSDTLIVDVLLYTEEPLSLVVPAPPPSSDLRSAVVDRLRILHDDDSTKVLRVLA